MRPGTIPDRMVWSGAKRVVMSAPNGDLTDDTVAPVECVVDCPPSLGVLVYSVRCVMEPGDLERLHRGGEVWVSFYGGMPPFSVAVAGGEAQ